MFNFTKKTLLLALFGVVSFSVAAVTEEEFRAAKNYFLKCRINPKDVPSDETGDRERFSSYLLSSFNMLKVEGKSEVENWQSLHVYHKSGIYEPWFGHPEDVKGTTKEMHNVIKLYIKEKLLSFGMTESEIDELGTDSSDRRK